MGFVLAFHLFGVVLWLGSLLTTALLLEAVPEEVGVAKERLIEAALRLINIASNFGAALAIALGILLIELEPAVLRQGWLHAKLLLVVIIVVMHARLYRRVVAMESEPSSATGREFTLLTIVLAVLLAGILILSIVRPF